MKQEHAHILQTSKQKQIRLDTTPNAAHANLTSMEEQQLSNVTPAAESTIRPPVLTSLDLQWIN